MAAEAQPIPNRLTPLFKFNEEQNAALRQIAPEAFRDGALDFGALCEALGYYERFSPPRFYSPTPQQFYI
ncbi:MAG: hypothetical protein LBR16_00050 [Treponema sp.]|jgi:hypothetical protein|nr:hypothetical protein [Treponema sp.]